MNYQKKLTLYTPMILLINICEPVIHELFKDMIFIWMEAIHVLITELQMINCFLKKNNMRLFVWNLLLIPRKAGFIICMLGSFFYIDSIQRPPHVAISPLNKRKTYDNITCNICKTSPIASLLLNVAIFLIPKNCRFEKLESFPFLWFISSKCLKAALAIRQSKRVARKIKV